MYLHRIEAKINILDKVKKSLTVLIGTGFLSTLAHGMTFSPSKLDTYAKETTSIFQNAGIDCKVDTKLKKISNKAFTVHFTYKCSDGSAKQIKVTKLGDMLTEIETGEVKNSDGDVDPNIEFVANNMVKMLKEEMHSDGFKVK